MNGGLRRMNAILCKYGKCTFSSSVQVQIPSNDDNWIKIKVKSAGLCGSDLHKILHSWPTDEYMQTKILGHEIAGVVADAANESNFKIGDRVVVEPLIACDKCINCLNGNYQFCGKLICIGRNVAGGFADFVYAPEKNLYALPSNITFDEGAMTDLLAVVVHAFNLINQPKNKKKIAIIGDGPLGLLSIQLARVRGFHEIVLYSKYERRRELAYKFGATNVVTELPAQYNNHFDIVVEAVGGRQSDTLATAINIASPKSQIIIMGVYDIGYVNDIPLRSSFYKELSIVGANSYSLFNGKREFEQALELIGNGSLDVKSIISHSLALEEFMTGLKMISDKRETNVIKMVFRPN